MFFIIKWAKNKWQQLPQYKGSTTPWRDFKSEHILKLAHEKTCLQDFLVIIFLFLIKGRFINSECFRITRKY